MKIKMCLKRYHDGDIACSAVYRIPKKLETNRLPVSQRYKRHDKRYTRYEKQLPGNRVQIDVKFIEPISLPEQTPAAAPVTATLPTRRRRAKYYHTPGSIRAPTTPSLRPTAVPVLPVPRRAPLRGHRKPPRPPAALGEDLD